MQATDRNPLLRSVSQASFKSKRSEYGSLLFRSDQMSRSVTAAPTATRGDIDSLVNKYHLMRDIGYAAKRDMTRFKVDVNDLRASLRNYRTLTSKALEGYQADLLNDVHSDLNVLLQGIADAETTREQLVSEVNELNLELKHTYRLELGAAGALGHCKAVVLIMGNLQCESKICCKGEGSALEEVKLAAESGNTTFIPSSAKAAQRATPPSQDYSLEPINLQTKLAAVANFDPVLMLKVVSSNSLPQNSTLRISSTGYEYSLRNAHDGVTYFGCKKRGRREGTAKGEVLNDVVMSISDAETAEKHRGRHFEILYRPERRSYWLRDLGVGFGAFLRLDSTTKLKDNTLVNIGESFIVVNLENADRPKLKLKLFGGPCKGEVFNFSERDFQDSYIHIGRVPTCEVVIDDTLISKCHASIWYEKNGWVICDGDAEKLRASTNGTWYSLCRLYMNDSYELREGVVFKASQTLFEVHLS